MEIKVNNVSKEYSSDNSKVKALENVSFSVKAGEIVAIIGKTGCGKTTLLNIISGLLKPDSGSVSVVGNIGYVFQGDSLLPWRNVLENIVLSKEISNSINSDVILEANNLIAKFGLNKFSKSYPNEISGGMKQKVVLARTLLQNPDIILFDEPFSAIDFDSRLKMVSDVRKLITSTNKCAVFVTHNIEEAISISDKIMVLGGSPTGVLFKSDINISENERDPEKIRKLEKFDNLFSEIFSILSKQNNE
jgi:NitT/TauT family transport system ATP-binding protein